MVLEQIDFLSGISCLIFVVISTIIGLKIILKYFRYKNRTLILVGFTWIILCEIWWSALVKFLAILITGEGINFEIYFLIGNILIPIGLLCWLTAFTDLLYKDRQNIILVIFAIIGILFEVFSIYFLFTEPSIIGEFRGIIDVEYRSFVIVYLIFVLLVFLITGIRFALESKKSDNPEIRLKGKILIIALILFFIGALFEGIKPMFFGPIYIVFLVLIRILLILSSIAFYYGFILPEWMKKIILSHN